MPGWVRRAGLLLLQLATAVSAVEMSLVCLGDTLLAWWWILICVQSQKDSNRQVCSGMYSRKSWGGSMDPFILTKFIKPKDANKQDDPLVSFVIFEWQDNDLIGVPAEGQGGVVSSTLIAWKLYATDRNNSDHIFATKKHRKLDTVASLDPSYSPTTPPKCRSHKSYPRRSTSTIRQPSATP